MSHGQPRRPSFTPNPQQQDPRYGQQQPWPQQQPYPPRPPQQPPYQAPGQVLPPYQPYQPGTPRRRRRRGRTVLAVLGGIAGLFVIVIVVAVVAASGNHTITTGQAGATSSGTASAKASGAPAQVGSAITLTGNNTGEQVAVTVVQVVTDAQPATDLDDPPSGDRLYAVQFRLHDTGSAAYSDSPSNGAAVVDSAGQSYQSGIEDAAGCQAFPGTENIAPGSSGLGCVVFEVPVSAKITQVQFTLDSGFGPQTGQWDVRS